MLGLVVKFGAASGFRIKTKETSMTASTYRESAKIYAFTPRARTGPTLHRDDVRSVTALKSVRPPVVDYNCWYHAEAVQESTDPRKR